MQFGIHEGVPDADDNPTASADGVRFGASKLAVMNADGTASPGTRYIRATAMSQYAARVLGTTGRIRLLKLDAIRRRWVDLS